MQSDDARRLRARWGDKPCDHPSTDKEYYLGADTGDYVCLRCGKSLSKAEAERIEAKANKKDK